MELQRYDFESGPERQDAVQPAAPQTAPRSALSTALDSAGRLLRRTGAWLAAHALLPPWLPEPLCRPHIVYAASVLLMVLAALVTVPFVHLIPDYSFKGAFVYLALAFIALNAGVGPSLVATLAGALAIDYFVLPPYNSLQVKGFGGVISMLVFLLIGTVISLIASQTEHARREAAEAHDQMNRFLTLTSHELKTPLTGLKMSLQLAGRHLRRVTARDPIVQDETLVAVQNLLDRSERQVTRLSHMVAELVDSSRLQSGRLTLHLEMTDLVAPIADEVEQTRLTAPERVVTLCLPEQPVMVRMDVDRIRQVLANYLTNALKYAPPDRPIAVELDLAGSDARVAVRDAGPGLTAEQQSRIWERGYRAHAIEARSDLGVGLGLGLYLSHEIVASHGGAVGVASTPGQGSTFWFTLPLADPATSTALSA